MDKCMRVLSLLPNPGKEWMYYCNTAEDVLQQGNAFDCGVFLCIYARALSLGDPLIVPDSLPDAWLMMIAELHLHQLGGIPPQELQPESYYALDYINKFYIGRLLAIRDGVLHFKFLHSNQCTGSMEFYWPRRDDMDTVSPYCVFYGPVNLNGNGPFTVNNLKLIVNLFYFIKRQRK